MADFYTQCPNMLIFGLPHLSSNDRIVMLSLLYLAWGDEEPLQISIRDLAKFNHISPSVLCDSAKNEEEKQKQIELGKFREGSLTRLSKLGYITVEEEGGKTYITVHLQKIWDDNAEFRKSKGVPNSNTIKSKSVRKSNSSVLNSNSETPSSVLNSNSTVLNSNTGGSQKGSTGGSSDPLRTNNNFNERMKERDVHTFIPSVSLDQCLEAVESFAEGYGDRDPIACRLEAEQLYRVSGLDSNAFWDTMFAVKETLGKKSQTMGVFFKRLREQVGKGPA